MWTPEFDSFVAPARVRPQLWRVIAGVFLVVAVYFLTILALLTAVLATVGFEGMGGWMNRIASAETPTAIILMLATFIGMFIGPMLAVRVLHNRPSLSLFGGHSTTGFVTAGLVACAVFAVSLVLLPPGYELVRNTPADLFWSFLPLALVGILLQTGAEEVLFRGYLQQQLAARFDHWVIWMVLPALLFGALHYDPVTAGPNAPWLVAAAALFGLVAADLTRVTGSIGAAWGVHFVNNVIAILIISLNGSLSGLSWWTTPFTAANTEVLRPLILQDMLVTVIVWACVRLWLARGNTTGAR